MRARFRRHVELRLAGMLKNCAAFMAFLDKAMNRRLRQLIMPGWVPGTITACEMKNEVLIMSKAGPCLEPNSRVPWDRKLQKSANRIGRHPARAGHPVAE